MNLPKTIKIGALRYKVRWVKDLNASGQCKDAEHEILIDREYNTSDEETMDTFLHECLHAMDRAAKLDLGEERVHRIAFMMTAFLFDNNLVPERLKGGG